MTIVFFSLFQGAEVFKEKYKFISQNYNLFLKFFTNRKKNSIEQMLVCQPVWFEIILYIFAKNFVLTFYLCVLMKQRICNATHMYWMHLFHIDCFSHQMRAVTHVDCTTVQRSKCKKHLICIQGPQSFNIFTPFCIKQNNVVTEAHGSNQTGNPNGLSPPKINLIYSSPNFLRDSRTIETPYSPPICLVVAKLS